MVLALSTFSATLFAFVVVTRNSGPPPRPQNQVLLRSVESNSADMGSVEFVKSVRYKLAERGRGCV